MNLKIKGITILLIMAFFLTLCALPEKLTAQRSFVWPEKYKAAVSLTFDDAIDNQAVNAAPLLKKYGFHGTFFLSGNQWAKPENISKWNVVYENGNELGTHTLHHPCQKAKALNYKSEHYTLKSMKEELEYQLFKFRALGKYREPMVFAYPCGITWVGEDKRAYIPIVKQLFSAARGFTDAFDRPLNNPLTVSLYEVKAANIEGKDAEYLIEMVKDAKKTNKWVVFAFHGIGGGYMITNTKEFQGLLRYLSKNRDSIWTVPFGRVAEYIRNNR
jgi:hypothetical protein